MNPIMKLVWRLLLGTTVMASVVNALPYAMHASPFEYPERNSDGSRTPLIRLLGSGEADGYTNTFEVTVDGYTVSKIKGDYMYLEFDDKNGKLVSSGLVAGKDDPKTAKSKNSGKKLGRYENAKVKKNKGSNGIEKNQRALIAQIEEENGIPSELSHVARRRTPVLGNKKNLMIPFKFSDHTSRAVPSTADLSILMNNVGPNALCPSGSVRDVYLASSYNQLVLDTTVAPWVTLPNPETYYAAGNSGLSTTAHIMIQDALNALQATGFDFTQFDTDNDGYVDAIGFLHSGYGAEWGGTDAYGTYYSNRIWSHKWAVYSLPGGKWTSTSGKSVYNYHISPSVWGTSGSAIGRIGVIAHETGHFFGLPDLYDGSGGDGVGSFCLMANSWGFDGSQYYPPLVSAWSKVQLGWVTPTLITASGTYVARQVCTYPDVFQISKNFPTSEYLLIENRQKCSFDAQISGPGLAIFHIDDSASYTTEGYPGQTGWPTNGNHYRVALLQADGSYNLEKGNNRGDATDLFFGGGVSGISPTGTSGGLAHPNTKAYKGGVIVDTGITISSIGASSSSMPFTVSFAAPAPTLAPTAAPVNQFSLTMLTDSWSLAETAWTLYQISSSPSVLIASKAIGSYGNNLPFTEKYILGPGLYQFNLTDAYGDGLVSPAYYTISLGGTVLKTGGAFTFLDSTTFTVGGPVTSPIAKPIQPVPKPVAPVPKPIASVPTPAAPVPKPTASVPKPVAPVPKPTASVPKPVAPVPKPTASVPKPVAPVPKPAAPVPKPAAPVPKPAAPVLTPVAPVPKPSSPVPLAPAPSLTPTSQFLLTMQTDSFASVDTAWTLYQITSSPPALVASKAIGSYGNNLPYSETYLLGSGMYQFNITDAWGDGLLSPGYYRISMCSVVLKRGGAFTFNESTTFEVL